MKLENVMQNIGLKKSEVVFYGEDKAKIKSDTYDKFSQKKDGKLILVTAISPTPAGEGKTTVSIGLADAINRISDKNRSILALREPSLGPIFGMKGGAIGGGKSQLTPGDDINLHFTGDLHAITSANNLLAALIDNHIYFGNNLNIDPNKILFKRCEDINDRSLREILVNSAGDFSRKNEDRYANFIAGFNITAASEVMAILALAEDLNDLKSRLSNILIGFSRKNEPIFARDLNAENAMAILLKDAINPNLVQTISNTPALVHAGPFANIAHGCNSVRATKMALKLGDYVITEAGFGADLGAEKFIDIKMRNSGLWPAASVLVATVRALKYNGGAKLNNLEKEDFSALEIGLDNLHSHIKILQKFDLPVIIALNKFDSDTKKELDFIKDFANKINIKCEVADVFSRKSELGENGENLARAVMKIADENEDENSGNKFIYDLSDSIDEKIKKIAKNIYNANENIPVKYSNNAQDFLDEIKNNASLDFAKSLPITIAKTQYSLSDDPKKLTIDLSKNSDFTISIEKIEINSGAGFLVVSTANIYRMPGLPKNPASYEMIINGDGKITGLK